MDNINHNKIKITLHCEDDNTNNFCCKIDDISEFLKEDALKQNKHMLNTTYVAYYNKKIIGFYTLSADAIPAKDLGEKYKEKFTDKNIGYKIYPALKLGRLGVHKEYDKKGVGSFLFKKVLKEGIVLSEKIGLRFITIDAYMSSYKFYEKIYCKHTLKKDKVENKIKDYEDLISKNNKRAKDMTIPMFYDLYRFKSLEK